MDTDTHTVRMSCYEKRLLCLSWTPGPIPWHVRLVRYACHWRDIARPYCSVIGRIDAGPSLGSDRGITTQSLPSFPVSSTRVRRMSGISQRKRAGETGTRRGGRSQRIGPHRRPAQYYWQNGATNYWDAPWERRRMGSPREQPKHVAQPSASRQTPRRSDPMGSLLLRSDFRSDGKSRRPGRAKLVGICNTNIGLSGNW